MFPPDRLIGTVDRGELPIGSRARDHHCGASQGCIQQYVADMTRDPQLIGGQRRAVGAALRRWGVDVDPLNTVVLVVSELLSNAVLYGGSSSIGLSVVHSPVGGWVRVEVNDRTPGPRAEPRPVGPDQEGGRGLLIVKALSEVWGTGARGALTWCTVRVAAGGVR